jgi:hypothetical protein
MVWNGTVFAFCSGYSSEFSERRLALATRPLRCKKSLPNPNNWDFSFDHYVAYSYHFIAGKTIGECVISDVRGNLSSMKMWDS